MPYRINARDARNSAEVIMRSVERYLLAWSPQYSKIVLKFLINRLVEIHNAIVEQENGGVEGDPSPPC